VYQKLTADRIAIPVPGEDIMLAGLTAPFATRALRGLTIAATAVLLSACASGGSESLTSMIGEKPDDIDSRTFSGGPKTELQKATEYWGKEFAAKPADAKAAVSYAKNLKAMGNKEQAYAVLQQAHAVNGNDRAINSEYGRLALEYDQVSLAQRLLAQADDPINPDWRVISARGTVLAKQGNHKDAIPLYRRALALAPNQASVLNNLALAYTMDGQPEEAERLLRQASNQPGGDPRVAQNLALVLGVQGKFDESKQIATATMPADAASSNADYLRQIVKVDAKPGSGAVASAGTKGAWSGDSVPLADKLLAQSILAEAKAEATGAAGMKPASTAQASKAKSNAPKSLALKGTAQPVAGAMASDPQVAAAGASTALPLRPSAP
jgi:Flp pilus assembly protein TadD